MVLSIKRQSAEQMVRELRQADNLFYRGRILPQVRKRIPIHLIDRRRRQCRHPHGLVVLAHRSTSADERSKANKSFTLHNLR